MKKEAILISIKIPTKSYIKKFIITRYGIEHTVSKKSMLGVIIVSLLDKNVLRPEYSFDSCDTEYTVHISEYYMNVRGFNLSVKTIKFLSVLLDKLFYEDLFTYMDISISKLNVSAQEALSCFFKEYNISEDELNFDSIYKKYQRHCNFNIKSKKNKI
jgi:hypothetical protein